MGLSYCTLASGSSGNAALVQSGDTAILLDCGLSGKTLWTALATREVDPGRIRAILVTHEHSDHSKGVGVVARKLGVPVYATCGTWQGMGNRLGALEQGQIKRVLPGERFTVGTLAIDSFPLSHDAREPCGYRFSDGVHSVGFLTDTGVALPQARQAMARCTGLVIESNYDVTMLREGPYPAFLKARIEGNQGHMSNGDCALLLQELVGLETRHVLLAHLSQDNNRPRLALAEIEKNWTGNRGVRFSVAPRYDAHPLISFDEEG